MAIDGISAASSLSVSGVRAANEQLRTLGAGISQLVQGAEQIAEGALGSSQGSAPAPSSDPSRGQTVDILA